LDLAPPKGIAEFNGVFERPNSKLAPAWWSLPGELKKQETPKKIRKLQISEIRDILIALSEGQFY